MECNKKWASLFSSKLKGKVISLVPHKVDWDFGACSISILDYIVDQNMAHMNMVLVGKFIGPHPNIEAVRSWVVRKWKGKGQTDVVAMAGGFFSFSFSCEEDFRSVLAGGPWMLGKASLALKKWEPGFNPNDWKCNEAPIWVRLPSLPMEFWGEEIFAGIVAIFGDVISIDPMTATKRCLVYARLCVNIKQSSNLSFEVDLFSKLSRWMQKFEYESISFVCFHCKKVGHWTRQCLSKPKKEWRKRNEFPL